MSFTDAHSSEGTKGAVHGALLTVAAMCSVYNACAFRARGGGRLAFNACVYAALVMFEGYQISRHCGQVDGCSV